MDASTTSAHRRVVQFFLLVSVTILAACTREEGPPLSENSGEHPRARSSQSRDSTELLALRERLDHLENTAPEEFETACETIIHSTSSSPEMVRIALLKRIRYFDELRLPKKAALDVFDYWRRLESGEGEDSADPFLLGVVSRAGFLLEAELLERTKHLRLHATRLSKEFRPREGSAAPASAAYFDRAPDTQWLSNEPSNAATVSVAQILHAARAARLCLYHQTTPSAFDFINEFIMHGNALVADATPSRDELLLLEDLSDLLLAHIARGQEEGGSDFAPWTYGSSASAGRAVEAAPRLAEFLLDVFLARMRTERETDMPEPMYSDLENMVDRFVDIGYPRLAEQTYAKYLEIRPDSHNRFQIGMLLAKLYVDTLNATEAAIEVYLSLANDDGIDSKQATAARLKACSVLITSKSFERAYLELQEISSEPASSAFFPQAEYLSAVCEFHLGEVDHAKQRMVDIAQHYPESPTSAAALLWVARQTLQAQDYAQARIYLEDLLLRYPSSTQAERAQSLQSQLESLEH